MRPLARAYLDLGYALTLQGRFDEAAAAIDRAVVIAREQGRTMDLIEGLHNRLWNHVFAGRRADPSDTEELTQLHATTNSPRGKAMAAAALGLAGLTDRSPGATEILGEAGRLASMTGLDVVEASYRGVAQIAAAAARLAVELALAPPPRRPSPARPSSPPSPIRTRDPLAPATALPPVGAAPPPPPTPPRRPARRTPRTNRPRWRTHAPVVVDHSTHHVVVKGQRRFHHRRIGLPRLRRPSVPVDKN